MSISENKKTGVRFNLFDVLLILAVIACVAGLVLHAYFTDDLTETYAETANITLTVTGISEKTASAFCRAGASVYLSETDEKVGQLLDASYDVMIVELENADGVLVNAVHPDKKTATATAVLTGTWTDDGFLIGGHTLAAIGKTLNIYTENAVCTVTLTGVTK